jgi:hypothetical protein
MSTNIIKNINNDDDLYNFVRISDNPIKNIKALPDPTMHLRIRDVTSEKFNSRARALYL